VKFSKNTNASRNEDAATFLEQRWASETIACKL
jgi:hypothetical protein